MNLNEHFTKLSSQKRIIYILLVFLILNISFYYIQLFNNLLYSTDITSNSLILSFFLFHIASFIYSFGSIVYNHTINKWFNVSIHIIMLTAMSSLLFIGGYQLTQNSYADSAVRFMTVYSGLFLIQSFFIGQKSILAFAIIQCVSIAILSLILAFAFEIAGTNQFETMLAIIPIISSLYSLFAAVYIFVYHKPTQ